MSIFDSWWWRLEFPGQLCCDDDRCLSSAQRIAHLPPPIFLFPLSLSLSLLSSPPSHPSTPPSHVPSTASHKRPVSHPLPPSPQHQDTCLTTPLTSMSQSLLLTRQKRLNFHTYLLPFTIHTLHTHRNSAVPSYIPFRGDRKLRRGAIGSHIPPLSPL